MEIVSRAEWDARPPNEPPVFTTWAKRDTFTVHRTGGGRDQSVRSVQDWCMGPEKRHSDIDYNALVRDDGTIYEGRTGLWLVIASHSYKHNTHSLGVAWLGNEGEPSAAAKASIRWLWQEASRRRAAAGFGSLTRVVHSDQVSTSCPGDALRSWTRAGMPVLQPEGGFTLYCNLGDDNEAVKEMQLDLIAAGFSVGASGADGEYGPATARGVAAMVGAGDGSTYQAAERAILQDLLRRKVAGGVTADDVRALIAGTKLVTS